MKSNINEKKILKSLENMTKYYEAVFLLYGLEISNRRVDNFLYNLCILRLEISRLSNGYIKVQDNRMKNKKIVKITKRGYTSKYTFFKIY